MLVIRRAQMDSLAAPQRELFEVRAVAVIRRCWPEEYAALGEGGARASVREGIARAERLGIVSERDVLRYINLTYLLGPRFEEREEHAGARAILEDQSLPAQTRLDRVASRVLEQSG